MADDARQEALAAWRSSGDQDALRRAIAGARRAGEPVGRLLDETLLPERTFASEGAYRVMALLPGARDRLPPWRAEEGARGGPFFCWRRVECLGTTPGEVEVPACHLWWLEPIGTLGKKRLPQILDEVRQQQVGGINLGGSQVTDELLANLVDQPWVTTVLLGACHKLTPAVIEHLPVGVRCLTVGGTKRLPQEALTALERFPELTMLDLAGSYADGTVSRIVAPLTQLTHLNVAGLSKFTNGQLSHLRALTELVDVAIGGENRITLSGVKELDGLPLQRLNVLGCSRYTDKALRELLRFPELTHIEMAYGTRNLSPEGLGQLAALPKLRSLGLAYGGFEGERLEQTRALLPGVTLTTAR